MNGGNKETIHLSSKRMETFLEYGYQIQLGQNA